MRMNDARLLGAIAGGRCFTLLSYVMAVVG
jgi:hypothetical protein